MSLEYKGKDTEGTEKAKKYLVHIVSKVSCEEKKTFISEKRFPFAKINFIIFKCVVQHYTLSRPLSVWWQKEAAGIPVSLHCFPPLEGH